jgi:alkanesulfonate monooxygenase SsuD/methylene tetrahydromethanopterin reductase-like flavin-dependent oxidoreductase (luciferase family)
MSDYGHDLSFGVFITPQSRNPETVIEQVRVAEAAGLDLATFMDHPYQPELLDTWTLLSYLAAKTERIRLSGYVLNLPSRPPAVLARAAASLDRLSSGRIELGIGPGDTFAAQSVAASGGARRSPAQSVEALSEAIDIIRAIWDVSVPGPLHRDGRYYRLDGAMRGPEPTHDISIWVPAAGPSMRRLVGRKADGWITGGAWMANVDAELALGNEAIDQAATEAGRDPSQVRRIFDFAGIFGRAGGGFVHGSPQRWVGTLLPLVLNHGIGTFILIVQDPAAIQTWGQEVAPALREAVSRQRGSSLNAS